MALFDRLDKNIDGAISRTEIIKAMRTEHEVGFVELGELWVCDNHCVGGHWRGMGVVDLSLNYSSSLCHVCVQCA